MQVRLSLWQSWPTTQSASVAQAGTQALAPTSQRSALGQSASVAQAGSAGTQAPARQRWPLGQPLSAVHVLGGGVKHAPRGTSQSWPAGHSPSMVHGGGGGVKHVALLGSQR